MRSESYLSDLKDAEETGRNLLTEKYGRMMASTAPEEYDKIKHFFPVLSDRRIRDQEEIIAMETAWNEAFCAAHPKYAGRGRLIHTEEDTPYATSSETYLQGELSTYSDRTVTLYGEWIRSVKRCDFIKNRESHIDAAYKRQRDIRDDDIHISLS